MRTLGELCLLGAFVSSGFAAFAGAMGWLREHPGLRRIGLGAALASLLALTAVTGILGAALLGKDFRFAYVAQYSSVHLPWHYSLSAIWVGQAGSLLVWAWLTVALALVYLLLARRQPSPSREPTFSVLMGYVCFLAAIMVFAADPMEASLATPREGAGLNPTLQHPAMLIHPPVVFLGYSLWAVPFALAAVALVRGHLDAGWVRAARPWALLAWAVLGAGVLLGAYWAYEELGWGGYWAWDPVENGSLMPWLTGTALIHSLMTWQYRGVLKKTTVALAIVTFGLCNFATFLTRSGIFSSLHAFSQSPIGWLFLVLMAGLAVGGGALLFLRRHKLAPQQAMASALSREGLVVIATIAWLLLTGVAIAGTVSMALSGLIMGQPVMLGVAFYNNVLIPTGIILLATMGMAPLVPWGAPPSAAQRRGLIAAAIAGLAAAGLAWVAGVRHVVELAVFGLTALAVVALLGALALDTWRRAPRQPWRGLMRTWRTQRRQYAGFAVHLGLAALAVGVAGSTLRKQQQDIALTVGQTVRWAGYDVRLVQVHQRELTDKLVAEVELELSRAGRRLATLIPAQHFHRLQRQWSSEVAIQGTWRGDVYVIVHSGEEDGTVNLTFVDNPLMRFVWLGGGLMGLGTFVRLWPSRRRAVRTAAAPAHETAAPAPLRPRALAAGWLFPLFLALGRLWGRS